MFENLKADINAAMERDPAVRSKWEVYLLYPGFRALKAYRKAHWLYQHKHYFWAEMISRRARRKTGIEIHPGACIGKGVFIDHGMGVVIGETAEIGDNVTIYQGVTLGGTGKDTGKRHPTIEEGVMISCGAKILGPIRIGAHSKIGSGSVVLKDVPPHCTVVGVPGRIVKMAGEKVEELDQIKLPDPIMEEFKRVNKRLEELEKAANLSVCRYSITTAIDNVTESESETQDTNFDKREN